MDKTSPFPQHEAALIALLDDPSPVVRQALHRELTRLGPSAVTLLRQAILNGTPQASQWLREIAGSDPDADFTHFIHSFHYELESGLLLLERTVFAELDASAPCLFLNAIATRCQELISVPSSAWEQCKQINRVLFHEYGFRGDAENRSNPLNSFLHQAIQRRKGLPITLSALYILVAQRCGLDLDPIGLPGHFLVGCHLDAEPFYIDPFAQGAFRTREEILDLLQRGHCATPEAMLMPLPVGDVLLRFCRNLIHQYTAENNFILARQFARFVHEFETTYARHA